MMLARDAALWTQRCERRRGGTKKHHVHPGYAFSTLRGTRLTHISQERVLDQPGVPNQHHDAHPAEHRRDGVLPWKKKSRRVNRRSVLVRRLL